MPEGPSSGVGSEDSRWTRIEHREVVGSTNEVARQHAVAGDEPGLVVVADHQTQGRGRRGRRWEDEPGTALLMSALVEDRYPRPTLVPLAAGLAVRDCLDGLGIAAALKWPNDVLVDDRKCAGILVEYVARPPSIVIGIGVNVQGQGASDRTTVAEWADEGIDRWGVLGSLLTALDQRLRATEHHPDELLDDYRRVCRTIGLDVEVETEDGVIAGAAEDVEEDGALVVRTGERVVTVRAGDVVHVRPA